MIGIPLKPARWAAKGRRRHPHPDTLASARRAAYSPGIGYDYRGRITIEPGKRGGKPCIRGLRVTVGVIVAQIGAGRSIDEVLADYPYLERDDILEALRYAAWRAQEREIELTEV